MLHLLTAPIGAPAVCDACASAKAEHCEIFPNDAVCATRCGFEFDSAAGLCKEIGSTIIPPPTDAPIIGGQGKFRYQYMPDLMKPPAGAAMVDCHGLVVDKDENILLTYHNDGHDQHCIIRWNPDGTNGTFVNDSPELCSGTPHGLKITTEADGEQYLYHANNAQKLAKTTLGGEKVWMVEGMFGQNETCGPDMCPSNSCSCKGGKAPYIPTWFATPPDSDYMYLCDGYGSDRVFAFESATGKFTGKTWGGRSPAGLHPGVTAARAQPHGNIQRE